MRLDWRQIPPAFCLVVSLRSVPPRSLCFSRVATSPFFWPCHPWKLGGRGAAIFFVTLSLQAKTRKNQNTPRSHRRISQVLWRWKRLKLRWASSVSWWWPWRLKQDEVARASPCEWWNVPRCRNVAVPKNSKKDPIYPYTYIDIYPNMWQKRTERTRHFWNLLDRFWLWSRQILIDTVHNICQLMV